MTLRVPWWLRSLPVNRLASFADFEQGAAKRLIPQRIVISLAHFAAEHAVDAVELPPHQHAGAVDRIHASVPDVAPVVELGTSFHTSALQAFGSHICGLEGNHVVRVAIIQPPFVEEQATILFEAFVEWCAWEGCEVIEGGITISGGGALLKGFAERISLTTEMDIVIAHDPTRAVINGAKEMLQVSEKAGIWNS